jgi:hypothetical protein
MFCPSCGAESTIELNYCNRCGANLSTPLMAAQELAPVSVTKPLLIVGAIMTFITLGGFAGIFSSAIELVRRNVGGDLPMGIIFFGMVTILTIDILLFRILSKLISAALGTPNRRLKKMPTENQALPYRPTTARLQSAPSVTENTTRFFDAYAPAPVIEPVKKTDRS